MPLQANHAGWKVRHSAAALQRTGDSLPVPSTSDFQIISALVMIMPAGKVWG